MRIIKSCNFDVWLVGRLSRSNVQNFFYFFCLVFFVWFSCFVIFFGEFRGQILESEDVQLLRWPVWALEYHSGGLICPYLASLSFCRICPACWSESIGHRHWDYFSLIVKLFTQPTKRNNGDINYQAGNQPAAYPNHPRFVRVTMLPTNRALRCLTLNVSRACHRSATPNSPILIDFRGLLS